MSSVQADLFAHDPQPPALPDGMRYERDFLSPAEEQSLIEIAKKAQVIKLTVEPRSIYLLRGPSRWAWQHSVAPTPTLRYSITFRTARHPQARRR